MSPSTKIAGLVTISVVSAYLGGFWTSTTANKPLVIPIAKYECGATVLDGKVYPATYRIIYRDLRQLGPNTDFGVECSAQEFAKVTISPLPRDNVR